MRCFDLILAELLLLAHLTYQQSQLVKNVCGKRGNLVCPPPNGIPLSTRIVGGQNTCAEQVPWNVLVENRQTLKDGEIEPYCGGVLVTEKHVISAAHCFWSNQNQYGVCPPQFERSDAQVCATRGCPQACTRVNLRDIKLHLGLTNRLDPDSGIMRDVVKIDIHEGWDRGSRLNDILEGHDLVVLTMSRSVNIFGDTVRPACLPELNFYPAVGSDAEVAGFGANIDSRDGSKKYPPLLQRAELAVRPRQNCSTIWQTSGNQICAFGRSASTIDTAQAEELRIADSCNGDSGGGLTQDRGDGREMVIGVISFGEPECGKRSGKPGVYTNIGEPENLIFIRKVINEQDDANSNFGTQTCIASNNKRCAFPFIFNGKLYASCTTENDPENKPWCSTLTDENRNHVTGTGEWGHCPGTCLKDITSTPGGGQNTIGNPGAQWSEWSACSKSCGSGQRTRTNSLCPRSVTNCISVEKEACNLNRCPAANTPPPNSRPTTAGGGNSNENEDSGEFQVSFKACQFSGTCGSSGSNSNAGSSSATSGTFTSNSANSNNGFSNGGTIFVTNGGGGGRPNFFNDPRGPPPPQRGGRPPPRRGPPPQGGRGEGRPPFRGGKTVFFIKETF